MGQFLSMSGVIGASQEEVVSSLRRFVDTNDGSMSAAKANLDDPDCMVISDGNNGTTVLYPGEFFDWDAASDFLSRDLGKAVFSFHIHDGDLWMYVLFCKGNVVDQFNPIPNYWGDLDRDSKVKWKGNAKAVCAAIPELSAASIERYLVWWDEPGHELDERTKAYEEDRFYYDDDWQLMDFMKRLGLDYPIDDAGQPLGNTYRFQCELVEEQ